MKNPHLFEIRGQLHTGVYAARSQRWMDYMLIVGSQNDDRLLVVFADPDVSVVFSEAWYRSVTVSKELIEECLTNLWQLLKLIQLDNRHHAGCRQIVISFQDFAETEKLFSPLLLSGFGKSQVVARSSLYHKVVLSLFIPFEKNVFQHQI